MTDRAGAAGSAEAGTAEDSTGARPATIAVSPKITARRVDPRRWTFAGKLPYDEGMNIPLETTQTLSEKPAISVSGVNVALGTGAARVHILKDLALRIGRGETVGLVGASGSGKSTLLMVLAGLERANSGAVTIAGTELNELDEDRLALFRGRNIGIVFQSFHLVPTMTALENVAVPLELAGERDALERAARELASVGLAERTHHYPSQLSGGEQQRVALARALAPEPAILLADEPTGNLDEATGAQIVDLIFAKQAERGMTLVLVTHDGALAERCDRVITLRSGHIETTAPRRQARAGAATRT